LTKLVIPGARGKETTIALEMPHVMLMWAIATGYLQIADCRLQIELQIANLRQCTVDDAGGEGASTRLIIISSVALSMSNGPATAAPRVISIAITTPPSS
jgi:hypothetical protein